MDVIKRLQNHNIKPSVQRIAIMSYLMEHRTHPSVDEIYTALAPSIPTLSKTTVYNTLKLLSEQGAAQTLTIDERNTCYDAETSLMPISCVNNAAKYTIWNIMPISSKWKIWTWTAMMYKRSIIIIKVSARIVWKVNS